jgi:hypothetical protein
MIHYALRCGDGHEFDGWFRNSQSFDEQARSGLLDCPVCASTDISRALMAPRISGRATAPAPAPQAEPAVSEKQVSVPAPTEPTPPAMPDEMRAVLQRLRAEVEKRCDYVGPHFAREVRRMAEHDEPPRPIYGEATPDEAAALAEDGIEVARIPWVPRADS